MPHQCTNCGHVFPDGSKEMLSGCPECGGNKFQFKQGSTDEIKAGEQQQTTLDSSGTDEADSSAAKSTSQPSTSAPPEEPQTTTDPASTADPSQPTSTTQSATEETDAELLNSDRDDTGESPAQSTARSDVVSEDELPETDRSQPAATDTSSSTTTESPETDTDDDSSLNQLRQELNDQFESIRIVSPGEYELNLMELYDRNEYIISLREDGRYVIEVPDGWGE